jgi:hypothetical protein
VLYHVYVLQAIERGRADIEAGRTISHEQVAEELRRKWLAPAGGGWDGQRRCEASTRDMS